MWHTGRKTQHIISFFNSSVLLLAPLGDRNTSLFGTRICIMCFFPLSKGTYHFIYFVIQVEYRAVTLAITCFFHHRGIEGVNRPEPDGCEWRALQSVSNLKKWWGFICPVVQVKSHRVWSLPTDWALRPPPWLTALMDAALLPPLS